MTRRARIIKPLRRGFSIRAIRVIRGQGVLSVVKMDLRLVGIISYGSQPVTRAKSPGREAMRFLFPLLTGLLLAPLAAADDWPQWLGPRRDGQWREAGILDKFPAGGPKVLWRKPCGTGYSSPSVAGGKVYL